MIMSGQVSSTAAGGGVANIPTYEEIVNTWSNHRMTGTAGEIIHGCKLFAFVQSETKRFMLSNYMPDSTVLVRVLMDGGPTLYVLSSTSDETMSYEINQAPDDCFASLNENGFMIDSDCYDPVVYCNNL